MSTSIEMSPVESQPVAVTVGTSPKVLNPFIGLFGAGIILVVVGYLVSDDTLKTLGYGALGSALTGGFVGYKSSPGTVSVETRTHHTDVVQSDGLLSPEAKVKMAKDTE